MLHGGALPPDGMDASLSQGFGCVSVLGWPFSLRFPFAFLCAELIMR